MSSTPHPVLIVSSLIISVLLSPVTSVPSSPSYSNHAANDSDSRLEERRISFSESAVPDGDDEDCDVSCWETLSCPGVGQECDPRLGFCVCAKGFTRDSRPCVGPMVGHLTCRKDLGDQGDPCDHDRDCIQNLICIPSASSLDKKTCEPPRSRLGDKCVSTGQCPSNAMCISTTWSSFDICHCSPTFRQEGNMCVKRIDIDDNDDTSGQ